MSGARPELPEEVRMLAGEYVLGVLGSAEMRAVGERATVDPALSQAIAGWERRLAPMLTAVSAVAPPETLWARIEHAKSQIAGTGQGTQPPARLAPVAPVAARPQAGPAWPRMAAARRVWPWKLATGASLALAAGLAAMVLAPSLAHRQYGPMPGARNLSLVAVLAPPERSGDARQDTAAQMATDTGLGHLVEPAPAIADPAPAVEGMTGFLAAAWPDGTVVLTALAPVQVPGGKALELWMQPPDAASPRSLGVLSAAADRVTLPRVPVAGTVLLVSLEPSGGSPTGAPTGRIVYLGTLRRLRR